ncbi:hypothetical protein JQC92_05885 [Shewanella sp. 202IG2-18]|uniref:hypothetical protein n=1 Tax=Parashewanella hymeniacidonis TaxID=2807618 RepID=UPI001961945D|nr:hypothetical protein [Parashewanella hymeniacidonis]MBM7071570.1 hypothetical protein [Parashewanella hymeniacidonis]
MKIRQLFVLLTLTILTGCSSTQLEQSCSSVASYLIPPESKNLYPAMITHIDGKPVLAQAFYKLSVGLHTITIAELVSAPSLIVPLKFRGTKTLTISMDEDKRYHLAALFNPKLTMPAKSSGFWKPDVWKKESFTCLIDPVKK